MTGRTSSVLVLVATLVACGGGGGAAVSAPGPTVNARGGGIWVGQSANDSQPGFVQVLIGVTTDAGEFRFLSLDTLGQFIGTFSVVGQSAAGSGTAWAPIGSTWLDGSVLSPVNITATLEERQRFDGSWTTGSNESGTFTLAYSNTHQRSAAFSKLNATWFSTEGGYSLAISIDQDGGMSGSDSDGCVYFGNASIPDATVNAYALEVAVTSCGALDGSFTGLGILDDEFVQDDTLIASVDNGLVATVFVLNRASR